MTDKLENIIAIVSDVLEIDVSLVNPDSNSRNIDEWDSVMSINIMTVVAREYNFEPSFEDIESFTSVRGISELVEKHSC